MPGILVAGSEGRDEREEYKWQFEQKAPYANWETYHAS